MSCAAIIVAAGEGRRVGFDKLRAPLLGKPVLQWTLDAFLRCPSIDTIAIVAPAERFACLGFDASRTVLRVDGGTERFHSVANGLEALSPAPGLVAIHDGARPCVAPEQIESCIASARQSGAAALAHRITETLQLVRPDGLVHRAVDRERLRAMETPQVFRYAIARQACQHVLEHGLHVTDDVSAATAIGVATQLVENPFPNPKITFPRDLAVAEALLRARSP